MIIYIERNKKIQGDKPGRTFDMGPKNAPTGYGVTVRMLRNNEVLDVIVDSEEEIMKIEERLERRGHFKLDCSKKTK